MEIWDASYLREHIVPFLREMDTGVDFILNRNHLSHVFLRE